MELQNAEFKEAFDEFDTVCVIVWGLMIVHILLECVLFVFCPRFSNIKVFVRPAPSCLFWFRLSPKRERGIKMKDDWKCFNSAPAELPCRNKYCKKKFWGTVWRLKQGSSDFSPLHSNVLFKEVHMVCMVEKYRHTCFHEPGHLLRNCLTGWKRSHLSQRASGRDEGDGAEPDWRRAAQHDPWGRPRRQRHDWISRVPGIDEAEGHGGAETLTVILSSPISSSPISASFSETTLARRPWR